MQDVNCGDHLNIDIGRDDTLCGVHRYYTVRYSTGYLLTNAQAHAYMLVPTIESHVIPYNLNLKGMTMVL